jgi:hypothetical protein
MVSSTGVICRLLGNWGGGWGEGVGRGEEVVDELDFGLKVAKLPFLHSRKAWVDHLEDHEMIAFCRSHVGVRRDTIFDE